MSFSKRPQSAELPPAHDHASFSKKPEMNEQNSLAREESPKYQRFADDHVEEYDEVDVAKHGPFDHPVPEDMGNKAIQRHPRPDARPVMRAFTMMCCVGIFCSHISLWGTFLTNEGRWDNMATSSVWLTLPVVFVVFWWEFASLVTSWARGRDITPVAHIVIQLLLGLACIVAIIFEGFYLAYWSSPLYRWDRLTQIVPEILVTLLLLCITGSVFTRFILAIKDHRRRKAAARLAKQPEQQEA